MRVARTLCRLGRQLPRRCLPRSVILRPLRRQRPQRQRQGGIATHPHGARNDRQHRIHNAYGETRTSDPMTLAGEVGRKPLFSPSRARIGLWNFCQGPIPSTHRLDPALGDVQNERETGFWTQPHALAAFGGRGAIRQRGRANAPAGSLRARPEKFRTSELSGVRYCLSRYRALTAARAGGRLRSGGR
jgi:hypothetical protein